MHGADDDDTDSEEDNVEFTGTDITLYRGLAARCNYLALDRPDLLYAAKEMSRDVAAGVWIVEAFETHCKVFVVSAPCCVAIRLQVWA